MPHRLAPILVLALAACEATDPEPLYDVQIAVDCVTCDAYPDDRYSTLRVMLRPASALLPNGYVQTDSFVGFNEWWLNDHGPVVLDAFSDVPAGEYIVTAAAPRIQAWPLTPCRGVEAADTVLNHRLSEDRRHYPYVWPYIRVTVPSAEPATGLRVIC